MRNDRGITHSNLVPFLDDGRIDEPELRRLINWLIERRQRLYNGSTGEFIRLSFEERARHPNRGGRKPRAGCPSWRARRIQPDDDPEACEAYASLRMCRGLDHGPVLLQSQPGEHRTFLPRSGQASPIDILLYNIPQFPTRSICRSSRGSRWTVADRRGQRQQPRHAPVSQYATRSNRSGPTWLRSAAKKSFPALLMGGDGGTIATSGSFGSRDEALQRFSREGRHEKPNGFNSSCWT